MTNLNQPNDKSEADNTQKRYDELLKALASEIKQEITPKHKILIIEDDVPTSSLMLSELQKTFGNDIVIISSKDLSKETKDKLPLIDGTFPQRESIPIPIEPFQYKNSVINSPINGKERRRERRKRK